MRPRLLDLFCGGGGAAMGYHRAGFDVVGVDIKPQPRYPFEFWRADAMEVMAGEQDRLDFPYDSADFDAIHASPPCQHASPMQALTKREYPNLIPATRELLSRTGLPYVIENVPRAIIRKDVMLCGTMFGLQVIRHRHFEVSGFDLHSMLSPCCCRNATITGRVVAFRNGGRVGLGRTRPERTGSLDFRDAMGIGWMTGREARQSTPPAYTEWIGNQIPT